VTVPHFSEAKLHYRTGDNIECLKKAERQEVAFRALRDNILLNYTLFSIALSRISLHLSLVLGYYHS
jgi:hypothetical protein